MSHLHYKVHTFEGPLDLLLDLIEERKLEINEVALASVTEQFLEHLRSLEEIHPEILVQFMTVAGKLLVIKSKALLPALELENDDDEENSLDLTTQLLLLKKYRQAGKALRELEKQNKQSFAIQRANNTPFFYPDPILKPGLLTEYAKQCQKHLNKSIALPQQVVTEVVSISEKIENLQNLISQKTQLALREILKSSQSKTDTIVTFLALLELTKQKILSVEQEANFSDIIITKNKQHESSLPN